MARSYLTGAERIRVRQQLADRYRAGDTIQGLAASTGRSYGAVRDLLLEARVTLRPRGPVRVGGGH
jgi:hypothetical protein